MDDIVVKAKISADHKLTAEVPEDLPAGEWEVVIRPRTADGGNARAVREAILAAHESVRKSATPSRTKEEIDAEAAAFSDEWE